MNPLRVGATAPDFLLKATDGEEENKEVSLSDTLRRGPVVLVFYRFDFGGI